MCTAVSFGTTPHYFGRNLDLEYSYDEAVTILPRNFPLPFRQAKPLLCHHAMIGMAIVAEGYPLFFDATNEVGLSMAGLNFPGNAHYFPVRPHLDNITPFELIPWVLGQCASVREAKELLNQCNICNIPFSAHYPLSPLHWIISDKECSIAVESIKDGLKIHHDPYGVLTNNPPFEYHRYNLANYLNCTAQIANDRFSGEFPVEPFSKGMGGIGLPGDFSSASRFVKAAFVKGNSCCGTEELENVCYFFRILDSVAMPKGCVQAEDGLEMTLYSSCCNTEKGIYYYTTLHNRSVTAVDLHREDLDSTHIIQYPLCKPLAVAWIN